jgi:4-alpha-glucanotransferase
LHRLYWVPAGRAASEGAYVRYPFDELYAVLSIESHRHRAVIVGENLGTVPPAVNRGLKRHGIREMYVVQYEQRGDPVRALRPVPGGAVASLNTHDMPPFAAAWRGLDVADRLDLGLLSAGGARAETRRRRRLNQALIQFLRKRGRLPRESSGEDDLQRALTAYLGASRAGTVLVNLEDLWGETAPQNVPGTTRERVNWRRRARLSLEQMKADPNVLAALAELNRIRK